MQEHHRERKRLQNQLREKDITLEKVGIQSPLVYQLFFHLGFLQTEAKYKNCIAKIEKDTASVLQQVSSYIIKYTVQ